jgi:hypothetical protein
MTRDEVAVLRKGAEKAARALEKGVRRFLAAQKLSVRELGRALGISGSYAAEIVNGRRRPSDGVLDRVMGMKTGRTKRG